MLGRLIRGLRALVPSRGAERDLQDELGFHLEREAEKLAASGLGPDEARRRAAVRFGSVAVAADECRDARRPRLLADLAADTRFAVRQMRHRPLTTVAMVVVLAIGLGFSTNVFVFVSSIISAPPSGVTRDADAVRVRGIDRGRGPGRAIGREFSYLEVLEYTTQTTIFSQVGAWTSTDVVIGVGSDGRDLQSGAATYVTADYFRVLGVAPVLGSGLPVETPGAPPPMAGLISDVVWTRHYDRSADVIGRTLRVNGTAVTIVGVLPPRFVGARSGGSAVRVWLPVSARSTVQPKAAPLASDAAVFGIVARLAPGVSLERATAAADSIARRVMGTSASTDVDRHATDVVPLLATNYFPPPDDPPAGETSSGMGRTVGLSTPLLVLLLTGTSVSALLAGQSLARRREMAVRVAMGAPRSRIVRQLLTEAALVALCGGGLGVALLWWILNAIEASMLEAPLVVTWHAGVFAGGLALVASLLFGLTPALHATRTAAADILKAGDLTRSRTRLQAGLVVAQIALTQPVLLGVGAVLLELRSDLGRRIAPGPTDEIVEVRFNTNPRYGAIDAERERAIARVRDRLEALPGVMRVAPEDVYRETARVSSHPADRVNGEDIGVTEVAVVGAAEGFFETMGMPIEVGRVFARGEDDLAGTVVVDAGLARRVWPGASAVGRRLMLGDTRSPRLSGDEVTVIGVVAERQNPQLFVPGTGDVTGLLLVRTVGPAAPVLGAIRAASLEAAPELPIVSSRTLAANEAEANRTLMRNVLLAAGTGLVGLALAAIGLYAVVAVAVEQRRREIGIRAAMGALPATTVRMFLRRGLTLCLAGVAIGLALSIAAARLIAAAEGREPPSGLLALGAGVTLFVFAVALLAAWIPARRAAAVDPLTVLRAE